MKSAGPDIVKPAERLLLELEDAVGDFPKKRKYGLGVEITNGAIEIVLLAQEAFRYERRKARQTEIVQQLSDEIDRLRARLQVAFDLNCFSSAGRFDGISLLIGEIGRQCGAWKRSIQQHLQGQSPAAFALPESPVTLIPPAASSQFEAIP